MNNTGLHILRSFQKRWQFLLVLEVFLYALGIASLSYVLSQNWIITTLLFITLSLLLLAFKKPWGVSQKKVSRYLDEHSKSLEYSTELLLSPKEELSRIAQLQSHKIEEQLEKIISKIKPKVALKRAFGFFFILVMLASLCHYFGHSTSFLNIPKNDSPQELITFIPLDSTLTKEEPPRITSQNLTIQYPMYSKVAVHKTTKMNIKALEGTKLYWNIVFDRAVEGVFFDNGTSEISMRRNGDTYGASTELSGSFFYNFRFTADNGTSYSSELYAVESIKDEAPLIEVKGLKKFTQFDVTDEKKISFQSTFSDDYGIVDAYVIATVTKGEGESVKFREEHIPFDSRWSSGAKELKLDKVIALESLKMVPGDELYFYIEAVDSKQPRANRVRSETYFAVIRDTLDGQFAVEGTMAADLMPDYFRSQRQLIIDTEKLIATKSQISKTAFNFTSNELGYDQKALRLKYGEFMGDEAESGVQVSQTAAAEESSENSDQDPLEDYTHDHDGSNEHNLVDHDHEEESPSEEENEDPLEAYVHNHEDPEASTLFAQSLKSKLRQAMAEMWDAELHLRLYKPENSLAYQYRALKLIQEIKNSARIYVHRIGFDPPPIKEDKRLTGDLEEVITRQRTKQAKKSDEFMAMRKSVTRLAALLSKKIVITSQDRSLFKEAGNELAILALKNPGNHLSTLQGLKWLSEGKQNSFESLRKIQAGLLKALPPLEINPSQNNAYRSEINEMMLKELLNNE